MRGGGEEERRCYMSMRAQEKEIMMKEIIDN